MVTINDGLEILELVKKFVSSGTQLFDAAQGFLPDLRGHKVLLLGNSGSGKSSLLENIILKNVEAKKIVGENQNWDPSNPTACCYEVLVKIQGVRRKVIFIDTPGNVAHDGELVRGLSQVGANKTMGIIYVTACGYCDQWHQDEKDAFEGNSQSPRADYIEKSREKERQFLDRWFLKNEMLHYKVGWVLTAMNKFDLWQNSASTIEKDYCKVGSIGSEIARISGVANYSNLPVYGGSIDGVGMFMKRSQPFSQDLLGQIRTKNESFTKHLIAKISDSVSV